MIDWTDPAARAALAERLGPAAYNQAHAKHIATSIVATVNGYRIRPIQSRFGRLFAVAGTDTAYPTLAEAEAYARSLPPCPSA